MSMLLQEGEEGSGIDHALSLYHGLADSVLGGASRGVGKKDFGRSSAAMEETVTTPLRFDRQDLARGMQNLLDAENEAYTIQTSLWEPPPNMSPMPGEGGPSAAETKTVVDYCFLNPGDGAPANGVGCSAATSILILCKDGSVYGASPIIIDKLAK